MMLPALDPWEARWAPYGDDDYAAVLAALRTDDVVLDIGAGDLRLARRMARVSRRVIAWEMQADLLARAQQPFPPNLLAQRADARVTPIPEGVTVAVLLMRHCQHYALYVSRLRAAGCVRLITNARWGMGVEIIPLTPGLPWDEAGPGWYACRRCGAVGFIETAAETLDDRAIAVVQDVEGCPACQDDGSGLGLIYNSFDGGK